MAKSLSYFVPKIGGQNPETRHAWVIGQLSSLTPGTRILDAGAGELRYKPYCKHLVYVSQDFGAYDGKGDGQGLQTGSWDQSQIDLLCDIVAIPQPDASFDAILCTEVLEHLPNPVEALREFARLLRPGGTLLITAPFASLTHFAPFHFATGFNRYFYQHHLPLLGFVVEILEENGNYFEFIAQETRRLPHISLQYAGRSFTWFDKLLFWVVLWRFAYWNRRSTGSESLLCFGFHVKAVKQMTPAP